MTVEPLPQREIRRGATIVGEIWKELRRRILRGHLLPGARLVELEIAGETGASQASVREALHLLERDGLVVRRGRCGTFVTEVAENEMRQIFQVRVMVETFAIQRAVEFVTVSRIAELRLLVERMRVAGKAGDAVRLEESDMAFHDRLLVWSEETTLLRVWALLLAQLERFLVAQDLRNFADLTEVADSHLPVIAALESGNPQVAAERLEHHMRRGISAAVLG
jgi:DNA-binding GntR family transcriptional regulator